MSTFRFALFTLPMLLALSGCQEATPTRLDYSMGERVSIGPLNYVVVESTWENELGEGFNVRMPSRRFLVLTLSVTNGGGAPVAIPFLSLEDPAGNLHQELQDGNGVGNWLGLLRNIAPAQTLLGRIVFDVPLTSFKLRLPDVSESGYDRYAWVDVPLSIDIDQLQPAMPGLN